MWTLNFGLIELGSVRCCCFGSEDCNTLLFFCRGYCCKNVILVECISWRGSWRIMKINVLTSVDFRGLQSCWFESIPISLCRVDVCGFSVETNSCIGCFDVVADGR